jgi:hypothetical protein
MHRSRLHRLPHQPTGMEHGALPRPSHMSDRSTSPAARTCQIGVPADVRSEYRQILRRVLVRCNFLQACDRAVRDVATFYVATFARGGAGAVHVLVLVLVARMCSSPHSSI